MTLYKHTAQAYNSVLHVVTLYTQNVGIKLNKLFIYGKEKREEKGQGGGRRRKKKKRRERRELNKLFPLTPFILTLKSLKRVEGSRPKLFAQRSGQYLQNFNFSLKCQRNSFKLFRFGGVTNGAGGKLPPPHTQKKNREGRQKMGREKREEKVREEEGEGRRKKRRERKGKEKEGEQWEKKKKGNKCMTGT